MATIPDQVMRDIREAAEISWRDDREMQDHAIRSEVESYQALQELDFGELAAKRDGIIADAYEFLGSWEDTLHSAQAEIEAFEKLGELTVTDVPADHLNSLKAAAAQEHDDYPAQLDYVENGIASFRYVRDIRAKIEPIRELLVRMEEIIGAECYNANIQNYSAWGVWEGEGRSFQYPVTFIADGTETKRRTAPAEIQPETLITGHYKFGANELGIYRALIRLVDMLERDYGLQTGRPASSGADVDGAALDGGA